MGSRCFSETVIGPRNSEPSNQRAQRRMQCAFAAQRGMRWRRIAVICTMAALVMCVQQTASFCPSYLPESMPKRALAPRRVSPLALRRTRWLHTSGDALARRAPPRFLTALQAKKGASGGKKLEFKDPIHARTSVLIVGAGIGGLATALALARRGFRVK
eukprot:3524560-Rhodomonas_salina.1